MFKKSDEFTYNLMPGFMALIAMKALDNENIEYEHVSIRDLPDGVPGGVKFIDKTFIAEEMRCIKAKVEPESFKSYLEKVFLRELPRP